MPLHTTHLVTSSRQDGQSTRIVHPLEGVSAAISALPTPRTMAEGEQSIYLLLLPLGSDVQVDDKIAATPVDTMLRPLGAPITYTVQDTETRGGLRPRVRARLVKITQ